MNKKDKKKAKENFIIALEKKHGILSAAAKAIGIHRDTILKWRKEDPEFEAAIQRTNESVIDFVEDALMKRIKDKDTLAIKFFLSTKGRGRGYTEKQVFEGDLTVNRPRIIYEDERDAD